MESKKVVFWKGEKGEKREEEGKGGEMGAEGLMLSLA